MNRSLLSIAGLVLALALFLSANVLSNATLRHARVDLTENKLYTLSDWSRNILEGIGEPVTLRFYKSEKSIQGIPRLQAYAKRVEELLQEYAAASGGKVRLEIINPEPFTDEELEAESRGLEGLLASLGGERIYLGLAGANSVDEEERIRFFSPEDEETLEYDVTKLIYSLTQKKTVGLLTPLPMVGEEPGFSMGQQPRPSWAIVDGVKELYEFRQIPVDADKIDDDIDALWIVHPKNLSPKAQYAIDQYAMRGGKIALFVDPHCEADAPNFPPGVNPSNQMQALMAPRGSSLDQLMRAWGVEMAPNQVAGDRKLAIQIRSQDRRGRQESVDYVCYMQVGSEQLNPDDFITKNVPNKLFIGAPGALNALEGDAYKDLEIETLVHTTRDAMLIDAARIQSFQLFPEPRRLLDEFVAANQEFALAMRVRGKAASAFPDGKPKDPTPEDPDAEIVEDDAPHIAYAEKPFDIVVVADADLLSDAFWARRMRSLTGGTVIQPMSDNATFLLNVLDELSGNARDLGEIRGSGKFERPFTLTKEIEEAAQKRYYAKIKELEDALTAAEKKLNDLQAAKTEQGGSMMILSEEQQVELEKFETERAKVGKELREVRRRSGEDLEALETRLKFYNMGLIPILVGAVAVGMGAFKGFRRRRRS